MRRVVPECQSHNQMSPNGAHAHRGMLVRNTERPEYIMYEANGCEGLFGANMSQYERNLTSRSFLIADRKRTCGVVGGLR